jgi:hypothetical protein
MNDNYGFICIIMPALILVLNITFSYRFPGAEIIVVEGVPSLRTCSIIETDNPHSLDEDSSNADDDPAQLVAKKRGELIDVMSRWGQPDFAERFRSLMKAWQKEAGAATDDATVTRVLDQFLNISKSVSSSKLLDTPSSTVLRRIRRDLRSLDRLNAAEDDDDLFNNWIAAATAHGVVSKAKEANESRSEEFSSFSSSEEALQKCKGVVGISNFSSLTLQI